jgi:hypothetical protein
VACYGPNHSFLIFSSRPYLLLLPKPKAIGTSHSSPSLFLSLSFLLCVPRTMEGNKANTRSSTAALVSPMASSSSTATSTNTTPMARRRAAPACSCRVTFFPSRSSNLPTQLASSRSPNSPYRPPVSVSSVFFPPPSAPPTVALSPFPLSL